VLFGRDWGKRDCELRVVPFYKNNDNDKDNDYDSMPASDPAELAVLCLFGSDRAIGDSRVSVIHKFICAGGVKGYWVWV